MDRKAQADASLHICLAQKLDRAMDRQAQLAKQ